MNMYKENQTTAADKNSAGKSTNEQKCQDYTWTPVQYMKIKLADVALQVQWKM